MLCGSIARLIARISVERAVAVLGREILHLALRRRRARRCRCPPWRARARPGARRTPWRRDLAGSSMSTSSVRWKLPSPTWPTIGASSRLAAMSRLGLGDAFGEPRDRHADVGRDRLRARPQRRGRPNRRRGAPARAGCGPPAWSPSRTDRRRARRRSRRSAPTARRRPPRCRGTRGTASASPAGSSLE